MLSWQRRWNRECAEKELLEKSGVRGLEDLPEEVLIKVAECLDLATQVNFWETSKHLCRTLNGRVCFVKDFECSASSDLRCHTEAFALCGIDLLSQLPRNLQYCMDSYVRVVYTDGHHFVDMVDIRHLEEQNVAWKSDGSMFRVEYITETPVIQEESDEESDEEDNVHIEHIVTKSDVHKLLCRAPSPDRIPEVRQIASRLVLQSSLITGSIEDLTRCVQYCFELMCSRRWCNSNIYIAFPPPSLHLKNAYLLACP